MSKIHHLKTHEEWDEAWPALQSLRNELDRDYFLESREDLVSNGYELFGLSSEGRIVCVAGLVIYAHVQTIGALVRASLSGTAGIAILTL